MKKKFIGVIGIVIVVIVGGIYYLTREEKIELSLKNKKEIIVEYGNTVQYSFDDLIQTKDIDKDKLKEIKTETKITDNLKNEDQKNYPEIGNYTINIKYQDQKLKKKVTIVLMAIMMTMVFFADAQAKAGCNHKHTGRTWIIAEKANCNHTGRKKQLCVRCRKVLLEKVIPKTKHKWKLTRKRRTRYDCLKCGGVKLKNEYGGWSYYFP